MRGLILEGGAMRGMFTAGVLDEWMENGIIFDGLCGVSAGAVFGCNYKSRQIGRTLRYNLRYCNDPRYCSFRSLITTGDLYGSDFCYRELPQKLDIFDECSFRENPMEYHVVCTDADTGKAIYKQLSRTDGDGIKWMQASASMPLVSRAVKIGDGAYLDGGIADSVPLKYFESIGYDKNVVVLTRPKHYRKKTSRLFPLLRPAFRRYPAIYKAMKTRGKMYNDTMEYLEQKEELGEIFVVRPPKAIDVNRTEHDPQKLQAAYDMGRKEGKVRLGALKEFLK